MSDADAPTREDLEREREEREQAIHPERVKHNRQTGGGEVREGELQDQIDEHNRRLTEVSQVKSPVDEEQQENDEEVA